MERIISALKNYLHKDELGNVFIFLDDLKKCNFAKEELHIIFAVFKEYNIKIKEVIYEKVPGRKKEPKDFSMLDNYLKERFITTSVAFKKLKDADTFAPTIDLEQILSLKLNEEQLKHAIEFIINNLNIHICGISSIKDNELLDGNVICFEGNKKLA